jgi:hypothetical protein
VVTKEVLQTITRDPSDLNESHMVEGVRGYFRIQGALVKIIQQDVSADIAQTRTAGITIDL